MLQARRQDAVKATPQSTVQIQLITDARRSAQSASFKDEQQLMKLIMSNESKAHHRKHPEARLIG